MTDTELFKKYASKSGRSEENIASLLNISPEAYKSKIDGKAEFCFSEISLLTYLFGLEEKPEVAKSIFFA